MSKNLMETLAEHAFGRKVPTDGVSCVACGKTGITDGDFKDEISIREFRITKMCQTCQDGAYDVLKKMEEAEDDEDDWIDSESKPHWMCQECGHKTEDPMPSDRAKFYARVEAKGSPKCPKCKSVGFMPVGW